jgi:hypothetical protein
MKRFSLLLGLSAILISAVAAFFSITGIAMLFVGHFTPVIIMGVSLEFAKLIIASFLYRYWNDVARTIKSYLFAGLLVLMLITSGGIFGFLSDAYNKSSGVSKIVDKELVLIQKQKESRESEIRRYQDRVNQLSDIREQQERRVDTMYTRHWAGTARNITTDIKATNSVVEQYNSKIESLQKDIVALDSSLISKENQVLSSDVGPLRYIANVFQVSMDIVVKWFILLIIFVFDPIAISLIVAFNITLFKDGRKIFNIIPTKDITTKKEINMHTKDIILEPKSELESTHHNNVSIPSTPKAELSQVNWHQ